MWSRRSAGGWLLRNAILFGMSSGFMSEELVDVYRWCTHPETWPSDAESGTVADRIDEWDVVQGPLGDAGTGRGGFG